MNTQEIHALVASHTQTTEYKLTSIMQEIDQTSALIKTLYRAALFAESENNTEISLCDVHAPSDTYLLKICNQQLSAMYQQINGIVKQLRDERKTPVSVADTSNN